MSFSSLDWTVVVIYGVVLLCIGIYFKPGTADAYFFGEFSLHPVVVGISLFASYLSTVTYLTLPGEVIQYGPLSTGIVLGYILAGWLVARLVIPRVMCSQVHTVYELLEVKYSRVERLVAGMVFLVLRLLWMALILYITTRYIVIPIFNVPSTLVLPVTISLAVITIAYTSLGGIRAVVYTDTLQAVILLGGTVLTITLITTKLGGFSAWWPHSWYAHWEPFSLVPSLSSARNIYGSFLTGFVWIWCTYAADQVAVQRYTLTGSIGKANRMLFSAILLSAVVTVLLSIVGLALLGYYLQTAPHSLVADTDTLFVRFITEQLPIGLVGLVTAAILSAAMSSLSSGINTSCSVLIYDALPSQWVQKRLIRQSLIFPLISLLIGIVVVILSLSIHSIEGNLFELGLKITNSLVVPLYILIHMTLFTRTRSTVALYTTFLVSLAAAVSLSFFDIYDITILWAMPIALAVGVAVAHLFDAIAPAKTPQ